jgi:hypothetical protein
MLAARWGAAIVHSGGPFFDSALLMRRLARLNHRVGIEDIANALITSGYTSLEDQAQALGVHRSTAWTMREYALSS